MQRNKERKKIDHRSGTQRHGKTYTKGLRPLSCCLLCKRTSSKKNKNKNGTEQMRRQKEKNKEKKMRFRVNRLKRMKRKNMHQCFMRESGQHTKREKNNNKRREQVRQQRKAK